MPVTDEGRCLGADRRSTMAEVETATQRIVVIAIAIIAVGAALALALAFAFRAAYVEVAASSSWPPFSMFDNIDRPDRPRGMQEEDLPRFFFRDRVPSPTGTGTEPASVGLGPALEVGSC